MTSLMIVVGSVRPGRVGLPVAEWVRAAAEKHDGFEIDFADLAEINLPFMDEPNHPVARKYIKAHTLAWSARVAAAEAFVFVTPEYNHSFAPALKNAFDYLYHEWARKAVGFVSYGNASGGIRGVMALEPAIATPGLVKATTSVEIPFAAKQLADGVFVPTERQAATLAKLLDELGPLTDALAPLRMR